MKRITLPLLVLVVAACAHRADIRYYTLDMAPSAELNPKYNLSVERIRPSEPLTRKEILIKKTATQIEYYAVDQWAADVGELVTEKLKAEFGPRKDGQDTLSITGTVLAFEQIDVASGAEACVKLDLVLRPEGASRYDAPFLDKTYEVHLPASAERPDAIVEALSKALENVAAQIVKDVNAR